MLLCLLAACQASQAPGAATPGPSNEASPAPSPSPTVDELARIIELRADWGLRSDPAWIEALADDPTSIMSELGILVSPEEEAQLREQFADEPRTALIAYGARHADQFGGLYIDRDAGGVTVMLFTDDLARHRLAVAALAPRGLRVEVRPARFTEAALRQLMDDFMDEQPGNEQFQMISLGLDTINNVVVLEAKSQIVGLKEQLEALYGGMLVANIYPVPGPWQNAAEGDGWRLLSAGRLRSSSFAYHVAVATNASEWQRIWDQTPAEQEAPTVDFDAEIVAGFGEGIGSSCPEVRLDAVVIDREARLVYSQMSDPLSPRICTDDLAGVAAFVVALSRDALPDSPFTLRLHEQLICTECVDSELIVDLR